MSTNTVSENDTVAESRPKHSDVCDSKSFITCFCIIARHQGLDIAPERLIHDYDLRSNDIPYRNLIKIAEDQGFSANLKEINVSDITKALGALPALIENKVGNWVVLAQVKSDDQGIQAELISIEGDEPRRITISAEDLEQSWSGKILFLKRKYSLDDENQPFGIRWFIPHIIKQKKLFRDIAVASIALTFLGLGTPIFFQLIIDKVLVHESYGTLYVLAIGIVFAILFDGLFNFLRRYILLYASNRIDIGLATHTFKHLTNIPITFFEKAPSGVLVKHMQQTEKIRQFLTGRLFLTLLETVSLLVFLPFLWLYSPILTAVVLGFCAMIGATIFFLMPAYQKRLRALYNAEGDRQALLVESISGIQTIKALALEPRQRKIWDSMSAGAIQQQFRVGQISAAVQTIVMILEKLMMVAIIGVGAQLVFDGTITVGALVAFNMLSGRVAQPLVALVSLIHEYQETSLSINMLASVMNQPTERGATKRGTRFPIEGKIDFDKVSFQYEPQGAPIIDGLSFTINSGEIFGIVGRSGSGKSTVLRLVQGLHAPLNGVLRIDNRDIREIDLVHLRQNIGVVLQENFLFRGTVKENLAASNPTATLEQILEVTRISGADEFIEKLPFGIDTKLEENASNLSGGQRQRLSIARALLRDPKILILDEATSALDPESESIVKDSLKRIAENRTLVIVSHRLSMLSDANKIMVLNNGKIEGGPSNHSNLLSECSAYKTMWDQQMGL